MLVEKEWSFDEDMGHGKARQGGKVERASRLSGL